MKSVEVANRVRDWLDIPMEVDIDVVSETRRYSTVWKVKINFAKGPSFYFVKSAIAGAETEYALWRRTEASLGNVAWYECLQPRIYEGGKFLISRASNMASIEQQIARDGLPNPFSWFRGLQSCFTLSGSCLKVVHRLNIQEGLIDQGLLRYIDNRATVLGDIGADARERLAVVIKGIGRTLVTNTHGDFVPGNVISDGQMISLVDFGIKEWDEMTPLWDIATMIVWLKRESHFRRQSPLHWFKGLRENLSRGFLTAYGFEELPVSIEWYVCCFARHLASYSGLDGNHPKQAQWHRQCMRQYLAQAESLCKIAN